MSFPQDGVMIRIPAHEARAQGRAAQGVQIMNKKPVDMVDAVASMVVCLRSRFEFYGCHRVKKLTRLKSPSFVAISFIPYALQHATCKASLGRRRCSLAHSRAILDME